MQRISIWRPANPFWGRATRLSTKISQTHQLHTSHRLNESANQSVGSEKNETPGNLGTSEQKPNLFQSLSKKLPQSGQASSAKSSITNEERKIFETIRQRFGGHVNGILPPAPEPKPEAKPVKLTTSNLPLHDLEVDKILSLFAPEISVESSIGNFEPQTSSPDHEVEKESESDNVPRVVTPAEVRSTAHQILQQLKTNINTSLREQATPPDKALWNYLNADVFPIVAMLQHPLLRPTANSFHRPYQLTFGDLKTSEADLHLPSCLESVPPQTPILPLITILYPAATLLAMRTYAAYLPHSDYALSIYPNIQSIGTTSFLLGANVHFFNVLIQLHWEVYSDLMEVKALLHDMRSFVVPWDTHTLAILRAIVEDSKVEGGDGRAKEWWDLTAQKADINSLMTYWIPRVEKSLKKSRGFFEG